MRPRKCRFLGNAPRCRFYKPTGVPMRDLKTVQLKDEELEALILCDHQGLDQQEAAEKMAVSRPTLSRILSCARKAIAKALAEGAALQIGGGTYMRINHSQKKTNQKGKKMKILITSTDKEIGAPMDKRFGRAAYFLIYDTDNKTISVIDNKDQVEAAQGAGIGSASLAAKAGVDAVITGRCGPKAKAVLDEAGIKIYISLNTTGAEALELFLEDKLPEMAA
ncbi:MAG: NifB/NifX family molybdenum-iron cluster-binding protein [Bdellovibrionales bacterium]